MLNVDITDAVAVNLASLLLCREDVFLFLVLRPTRLRCESIKKDERKRNFNPHQPGLPRPMFGTQGIQNQWPMVQSVTAFYAFMASEAFFSCTGLGCPELTPTRRWSCSIKTNIKTVLGLFTKHHQLPIRHLTLDQEPLTQV